MAYDPMIIRIELERATLSMVQAVDAALSTEAVKAAIEKAINAFDFDSAVAGAVTAEVARQIRYKVEARAREKVTRVVEAALKNAGLPEDAP